MKYATLIYLPNGNGDDPRSEGEMAEVSEEYSRLSQAPGVYAGEGLATTEAATTVRDTLITDGPFADAKEVLGGYYILEAPDLDAALEFARRIPAVRLGGAVEVRPLVDVAGEAAH